MDSTQRSPRLPALPPLQSQQSTPKKVGNNERRRRPPPPILTSPVTPTSGSSFTVVPSRSSEKQQPQIDQQHLYSSPFVTEVSVSEKRAPAPKVYISPFVGDPSVFRSPETLPNSSFSNNSDSPASQSDNNNYNNNRLSSSSTSSIFTNNVTMPNIEFEGFASSDSKDITMKALPALPPRTFSGPVNAATKTTATSSSTLQFNGPVEHRYNDMAVPETLPALDAISPISTGNFNWSTSDKSSLQNTTLYYPQPPKMKDVSNGAIGPNEPRLSDSISSYYSNSSYAFNKNVEEYARHESFGSITGSKPLNNVASITVPTYPFTIDLLDERKLYQCYNISQLSHIYQWLLKVYFEWFNEYVFGKLEFFQIVQLLLEFQLPNSCEQDIIDSNVDKIIESLILQGAVRFEDDPETGNQITIIIAGLDTQGVFTDLLPCYSYSHIYDDPTTDLKCYSYTCWSSKGSENYRSQLKISEFINKSVGLWTDYWKLTPEELSEINPKEVKRQSFIFDLIVLEERSLNLANAAVEIYGASFDPALLPDDPNFKSMAYDIFIPLIELHKDILLSPILWKLKIKGKFIDGVGKIYLKWANDAKQVYVKYAQNMATVHEIINWEKENNTRFASWLRQIDESTPITRSKLYHDVIFFGGFFKSLQNMPVTLRSVLKCTDPSMDDHEYLRMAIQEIEQLSRLVDKAHGDAIDKRKIVRLARQLIFTSKTGNTVNYLNIQSGNDSVSNFTTNNEHLDLKLGDGDRKLIMQGILQKKRELWLESAPVYVFLLDNYFLITEEIFKGSGKKYKLIERPIPIDYLSVETKEDINYKRKSLSDADEESCNVQTPSTSKKPPLLPAGTTMSSIPKTIYQTATNATLNNDDNEESSYSFKIRNTASNESHTFSTSTMEEREHWVASLVKAFQNHMGHNEKQAFQLQCLCDLFSYDEIQAPTNLPLEPEGSAVSSAMKEFYSVNSPKTFASMKGDILCSVSFQYENETFLLCSVNHGVYITLPRLLHQWKRILNFSKVTKMEISTKLGLLFLLADRKLCYFNIPSLISAFYDSEQYLPDNRIVGIIIQEKITFFKMAEDFSNSRHLFYERKGEIIIMTPEFDPLTKVFKFFKHYKSYKIPVSSSGLTASTVSDITILRNSFIVCSSKGAILYSDSFNEEGAFLPTTLTDTSKLKLNHLSFRKQTESKSKNNSSTMKMAEYVKSDILSKKTKPIACFRIDPNNFIICYDEAIIRINKFGEIPDWKKDILVLDFYCIGVSLNLGHLILAGDNLVQVYNLRFVDTGEWALNTIKPVQIIKGKKIKITDTSQDCTSIVLTHPNIAGRQLLLHFNLSV